jgi:hypothetical protein
VARREGSPPPSSWVVDLLWTTAYSLLTRA